MHAWHDPVYAELLKVELGLDPLNTSSSMLSVRRHPTDPSRPVVLLSDAPHVGKKAR
jgi:hypothetical protein